MQTIREFTLRYAGLSFYWAWVFLSFNSLDIVGGSGRAISLVHMASSASAMVMFAACALGWRAVAGWSAGRVRAVLLACGAAGAAATFLYASPLFAGSVEAMGAGAVVTGFACTPIVLAWGVTYGDLDARRAVLFTSMTFFGAALLYGAVSLLGAASASIAVSLFPLAAAATAAASLRGWRAERRPDAGGEPARTEIRELVRTALSWRVLAGLIAALFAFGGLRVYFGDIAPDVFSNPALMAGTIALAALIFFVYGAFVSRSSLNLGVLYRIAMSVWALAFVLIAVVGHDNATMVFFMATLSSVLFEVLTWALLVEIARTTHFSAVLVFAMGRLAVHVGIVAGELTAFALIGDLVLFAVVAVFVLVISAGFTFADRDTTFAFESPTPSELKRLAGSRPAADALPSKELVPDEADLAARIDALAALYQLSPREKEVFALWVTGHGSKYIQERFVISPATVKTHVRHIYEKCDVHNRAELMRKLEDAR
ncbi:helix-turn-helix domain-containing protein [Arabiibacter massiliensis]|uniref:helix-turn-helix domain-containing protein n=1 Tax=Arabiibacter massiliensis TaxID=1870985 RepID=UPI001E4DFE64|nr:helix-turn-helix transcriptional regulator [Arabiibacter massiliensis]